MRASRQRLAGSVVAAALLVALTPAAADAGSMYVHSADRGKLAGGRLTLYDVGRKVTWTTTNGRAGVVRITRAHKRLFSPKTPATGTLHIAGQRGGQEFAFRLSKPRYSAASRTVSYRARPVAKGSAAASTAAAAPRSFGSASLSVVPHASIAPAGTGGNECVAGFTNDTWYGMTYVSREKWDTDTWGTDNATERFFTTGFIVGSTNILFPANGGTILQWNGAQWESDGGLWRGCWNHTYWVLVTDPEDPVTSGVPPAVTIDFVISWPWGQLPTYSCSSSDPRFTCALDENARWHVRDTQRPPQCWQCWPIRSGWSRAARPATR